MDENRLIDLETKLAYQERLIDDLEQVVTDQQRRLTEVESLCKHLLEKLHALREADGPSSPEDERPPHY